MKNYLKSIIILILATLIYNSISAQELEWGVMTGPLVTRPINSSYSVYGMISEEIEGKTNFFYSAFARRDIRKKWLGELQLGYYNYSYTVESVYEQTQFVTYSMMNRDYDFVEINFNLHYKVLEGKHGLNILMGGGLGSAVSSSIYLEQHLNTGDVLKLNSDFTSQEPDMQFAYQIGLEYKYEFDRFSILLRPFFKKFAKEQYLPPTRTLSVYGLGVGLLF